MRPDATAGDSFRWTAVIPNWGCRTFLVLLVFAAAGCDLFRPADGYGNLQSVAGSLTTDGGESLDGGVSPSDGGAGPGLLVVETKLPTSGMTAWSQFGSSLAVSGDVLVSGAPATVIDGEMYAGAAYVFYRDTATNHWLEQKQLLPHDTLAFFNFGQAVAVDGDTVAVTVPSGTLNGVAQEAGVYVFGRLEGGPDQWGGLVKITDPVVGAGGVFATSVTLAGDLVYVGAVSASADGMVMIFERNRGGPNTWVKIATILESDLGGAKGTDEAFGSVTAVDGDNLLIGAPPDRSTNEEGDLTWLNNNGAAYLFTRDPINRDQWTYVTRLASGAAADELDDFGLQVALKGDTAIVAAQNALGVAAAGAVYVFRRDESAPGSWPQTAKLTATDGLRTDKFGSAISFAGDTLLIGASNKHVGFNVGQGGAYIFRRSTAALDVWEQTSILIASDGQASDGFGSAVALAGETSIVGSPRREGDGSPAGLHDFGAAYLYELQELPPPPPVQCQPAFPPTDTLPNGGAITSPLGVLVATAPGTVPAPLPIWILEAQPPVEPLYAGAVPLGAYYNVGAQCTTFAPVSTPFVVGLPVPDGADTTHLAVGVLVAGSSLLDVTSPDRAWQRLSGVYDSARRLFLTTMAALDAGGNTVVLIQDPGLESTRLSGASRIAAGTPTFIVQCKGMDPLLCRADDKAGIEKLLFEAYKDYKRQGFLDPALVNAVPNLGPVIPGTDVAVTFDYPATYGDINIEPKTTPDCIDALAYYAPATKSLVFCGDPRLNSAAQLKYLARHELFHAVQYAYPQVGSHHEPWVIEGTATTAAAWNGSAMNRTDELFYTLRRADVSLAATIGLTEYQAQDFWVHLFTSTSPYGGRRALPLGELVSFFERGATTATVAERLGNADSLIYGSLSAEYWGWTKNQVIEKTDVTFDEPGAGPEDVLGHACQIEPRLISAPGGHLPGFSYTSSHDHLDGAILGILQSTVVQIHFPVEADAVTVVVEGESSSVTSGLSYKVYLRDDEVSCLSQPSNESRRFVQLKAGSDVYVLLANTNTSSAAGTLNYKVTVVPGG
jgi:hypothetical protein